MTLAETAARFDLGPYWRTNAADGRGASSILSGTEGSLLYFYSPDGVRTYLIRTQAPFAVEQIQRAVGAQVDGRFGDATRLAIIRRMRADGINIPDTTPAVEQVVAYALRRAFHDGRGAVALPPRFLYPNPSTATRAQGRSTLLQAIDTSTGQAVPVTQANAAATASQRTETVTQYTPPTTTSQTTPTQGAERYVPMPPQPGSTGGAQTVQNYAGTQQTTQTTTSTTQHATPPVPHTMPLVPASPFRCPPGYTQGPRSCKPDGTIAGLTEFAIPGAPSAPTGHYLNVEQLIADATAAGVSASELDRMLLADRSIAAPTTDGDRGYYKAIGLVGAAMATTGLVVAATR